MKKRYGIILAVGLGVTMLAGCEKTPDEVVVKEKGKENIANYETSENTGESIRKKTGAPENYANKLSIENGKLVIDTNAVLNIPEAEVVNTIGVKAKDINQELLDKITNVFFGNSPIYDASYYKKMTKQQIQEQITILKKYAAEGNLDPYKYGSDENGNPMYDIYGLIAKYEEEYKTAPEKAEEKKVTPMFGIEYKEEDGTVTKSEDHFSGVAETEQGNYDYMIMKMGGESKEITFDINKIREDVEPGFSIDWLPSNNFRNEGAEPYITEEKLKEYAGISYEEAEKIAADKVKELNIKGMELAGWDYSICHKVEQGVQKESDIIDGGFEFYFSRNLGGVPISYTDNYGGGLQSMESTEVPWGYEVLNIIVGDDGIQSVRFSNPYEIGEIQKENVVLMKFEDIIKIYEQMMEVSNSEITKMEKQRTYHVKRVTFGYTRIYDPKADNGSGVLVPVWDFFGGFDVQMDDYSIKNSGDYSNQSFMTINAIDGTVIDRSLGY